MGHSVGVDFAGLLCCHDHGDSWLPAFAKERDEGVRACNFADRRQELVCFVYHYPANGHFFFFGLFVFFQNIVDCLVDGAEFFVFSCEHAFNEEFHADNAHDELFDSPAAGHGDVRAHIKDGDLSCGGEFFDGCCRG